MRHPLLHLMLRVSVIGNRLISYLMVRLSVMMGVALLVMLLPSVSQWSETVNMIHPVVWWFTEGVTLILAFKLREKNINYSQLYCYLLIVFAAAVHGYFMAKCYWDWKLLVSNLMTFSLPLISLVMVDIRKAETILGIWYKWIPVSIVILFLLGDEPHFYGRLMMPYSLLFIFLPILNKRTRLLCFFALAVVFIMARTDRSDTLRFTLAFLLGICCYKKYYKHFKKIIKPLAIVLLVSPFILFGLAATGVFNILNIGEEMGWEYKYDVEGGHSKELFSDDRTFLYEEEIVSSIRHNYWLLGRSLARGYDSVFFGKQIKGDLKWNRTERQSCETAILNIFNYMGIIGVVAFSCVIFSAVFRAVWQSNNKFIPVLGLYLAFRFFYSWLEEFQRFDTNYVLFWIIVGICYSQQFRSLSDQQLKYVIRRITNY